MIHPSDHRLGDGVTYGLTGYDEFLLLLSMYCSPDSPSSSTYTKLFDGFFSFFTSRMETSLTLESASQRYLYDNQHNMSTLWNYPALLNAFYEEYMLTQALRALYHVLSTHPLHFE
jgi:hypothetical protein